MEADLKKTSFANVRMVEHPLLLRELTVIRDKNTTMEDFRNAVGRITTLLGYHALKNLPVSDYPIETPVTKTMGHKIDQEVVIVPILRAGLGMVNPLIQFVPEAKVGHLGMYRDETTHNPVDYYANIPGNIAEDFVLLVDPMLATGGSADDAISYLKEKGAQNIIFLALISAPEGLKILEEKHPDVSIITAAVDEELNSDKFIVPGLGDAGDRYFGTL